MLQISSMIFRDSTAQAHMKDFTEIDSIYRETISKLDLKERINYCENLIDDLQDKLLKRKRVSKEIHNELYEILLAAQIEIKELRSE